MNEKIQLLDRFYNSFISLDNPKDFFNGLCDYIDYLESVPEFDRISKELLGKVKPFDEKIEKLNLIGVKKMKEVHKELSDYISANKIESAEIKEAFNEYDAWLNGKIVGSRELADALHDKLCDVVRLLYEKPEHKEFASKYIIFWKDKVNTKHWLYPPEIKEYFDFLKDAQEKYKTELWGRMNDVNKFYNIIKNGGERRKELVRASIEDNSLKASYELFSSHDILYGEWKQIENGKFDKAIFFDVKEVKPVIIRFQNYILKELNTQKNEGKNALQSLNEMENQMLGIDNIPQKSFADIQKEVGESQKWQRQQDLEDKRHRETLKQNRILATKESKYLHAIDTIIERADLGNESFSIDYYYFNFEDRMDASKMLEKFLSELRGGGCFENYSRTNYAGGVRFSFIKVNAQKLNEFREKQIKTEGISKGTIAPKKPETKKSKQRNKIEKIKIIEMKNGKHLIVVNDNYNEAKPIKNTEWWGIFIKEIKERGMFNRTNIKEIPKSMVDYFNYNKGKCPIYMGGKYDLTDIFVGRSKDTTINPEVKTKTMTETQYLTRKNRKKKK